MSLLRERRMLILPVALALLLLGGGVWWWNTGRTADREVVFTVPQGTADRLAAGETVQVLPQTIELTRGWKDILVIRNEDNQQVTIGPYVLEPGQAFRQRYYSRGTFDLVCSIHPGDQLRVVVR
ncbi:MAG: hypothetical protein HC828_21630 [Blastochloris sp.]|nr:hypothetical protein [Blastochloris sp.]